MTGDNPRWEARMAAKALARKFSAALEHAGPMPEVDCADCWLPSLKLYEDGVWRVERLCGRDCDHAHHAGDGVPVAASCEVGDV